MNTLFCKPTVLSRFPIQPFPPLLGLVPYEYPGYRNTRSRNLSSTLAMPSHTLPWPRAREFQGVVDIRLRCLEKASHQSFETPFGLLTILPLRSEVWRHDIYKASHVS